jgi:hypothetical protein
VRLPYRDVGVSFHISRIPYGLEEKNIRCGADAGFGTEFSWNFTDVEPSGASFTVCGSGGAGIDAPKPLLHTLSCIYG